MPNEIVVEEKALKPELLQQSVVDTPTVQERQSPRAAPIILTVASQSQSITPWGVNPKLRDQELRAFWSTEPWLASVVYSVSIRNSSFVWDVVGADPSEPAPKNTIRAVKRMLKNANMGKGWKNLLVKTCTDLYTQDNGSWWQLLREGPGEPVKGILHLDAGSCLRTGDPLRPCIYSDRYGRERIMNWWEIKSIEELPSPIEKAFDLQYSAVTRCLLAAEIIQSIAVYKQEKVGGTFTRAIDIVSGPTQQNIDDGLRLAREQILNRGLVRYSLPVIIPGLDPSATLSHIHLDLASLPDNFDEDTSFKWYVAQLAAAFGVDYQEIAPLMTGSLGSSQQSEIMHLKTHGKGPALFMGLLEDIINDGLIPSNVEFKFLEQDLRSESEKAEARFTRSKDRSMRVKSGELDGVAARRVAVADGDLPEWMADEIDEREKKLAKEGKPLPSDQEQGRQEFTANQIDGGIQTQEEKTVKPVTMEDVNRLRKAISKDPQKLLDALENAEEEVTDVSDD